MSTWLDAQQRQKIQVFFATLVPIAVLIGLTTETAAEQWLLILGAALQFTSSALSLANLKGGVHAAWTILRGAVYALAATVAPALTVLGLISDEQGATALTAISLGLTSLSSLIAVFVSGNQQTAHAEGAELGRYAGQGENSDI